MQESGRLDTVVDGVEPRHHQGYESGNSAKKERGHDSVRKNLRKLVNVWNDIHA